MKNNKSHFYMMVILFKIRDFLLPRVEILNEDGIKPGDKVLDFGCGPGGYIIPASKAVGASGRVYALDVLPEAVNMAQRIIKRNKLTNVSVIRSDCNTGLPDKSIDKVFLYDVYHGLSKPDLIFDELYRVLKKKGTLSFIDHHTEEKDILDIFKKDRRFFFQKKSKKAYSFIKE